MKTVLAVLALAGIAFLAGASTNEADDIDIIMSDMPLKGEHQANDPTVVYVFIGVETCKGEPI